MIKYDANGYPTNVIAPMGKILDMREAHLLQLENRRLTRQKLLGMTALEINNNWDDVQSFLTQQQGKKNYE